MDSIIQFFKNLGTGRLIVIGVVGAITFTFFAFVLGRLQSAPMTVLFSDLEPAQAGEVVQRLEADQIQYETAAGGRVIRVPQDQVDRLRLTLAGEGLTGGVVGKEIFDQDSSFGRTSFELNVNFVRATEGELARTISYIGSVRDARVHIVMPERRPFQREASEPSASILLRTSGGGVTSNQVRAIQALVASAIPGLKSDRVTVTDTNGELLSDGNARTVEGSFSSLEEARIATEEQLRSKIESLLGRSVGAGNVRAEVAVQMNTSRRTQNETRYDPEGQVLAGQDVTEESSTERQSGGQVTVSNNLPEADAAATDGGGTNTSRTQEISEFQNSKTETVTITEPGAITKLSVSVMINERMIIDENGEVTGYEARSQDEITNFKTLVQSAIPYDIDRDGEEAITVVSMRFVDTQNFEATEQPFNFFGLNKQDLVELVQLLGLIISVILVLVLVVRPVVTRIVEAIPDAPPPPDPAQLEAARIAAETAQAPAALEAPQGITPEILALAAEGDEQAQSLVAAAKTSGDLQLANLAADARIDVARVEGRVQDSAIKKVSDIVKSNPGDSVAIVRSWLYAE